MWRSEHDMWRPNKTRRLRRISDVLNSTCGVLNMMRRPNMIKSRSKQGIRRSELEIRCSNHDEAPELDKRRLNRIFTALQASRLKQSSVQNATSPIMIPQTLRLLISTGYSTRVPLN